MKELDKNQKLKQILLFKNLPNNKFKKESLLIKRQKLNIAGSKCFSIAQHGMLKGFVLVMTPLADPNPRNEDGEDGDLGVPVLWTLTASEDDLTGLADNLR